MLPRNVLALRLPKPLLARGVALRECPRSGLLSRLPNVHVELIGVLCALSQNTLNIRGTYGGRGGYLIGGHSLGGLNAITAAYHLEAMGFEVNTVRSLSADAHSRVLCYMCTRVG
jgi:thioesterase domain-containing protein